MTSRNLKWRVLLIWLSLDVYLYLNVLVYSGWDRPFYTVHDCFYGLAGDMDDFCAQARIEFKNVIEANPMQTLIDSNEGEIEMPPIGNHDIDECLEATYMFS